MTLPIGPGEACRFSPSEALSAPPSLPVPKVDWAHANAVHCSESAVPLFLFHSSEGNTRARHANTHLASSLLLGTQSAVRSPTRTQKPGDTTRPLTPQTRRRHGHTVHSKTPVPSSSTGMQDPQVPTTGREGGKALSSWAKRNGGRLGHMTRRHRSLRLNAHRHCQGDVGFRTAKRTPTAAGWTAQPRPGVRTGCRPVCG